MAMVYKYRNISSRVTIHYDGVGHWDPLQIVEVKQPVTHTLLELVDSYDDGTTPSDPTSQPPITDDRLSQIAFFDGGNLSEHSLSYWQKG